jgi:DNA-binding NarL/FixJ family response regulator
VLTDRLTYRQIAILRRLCAGQTVAEVATAFGVRPGTVRAARTSALWRIPQGATFADVCRELNDGESAPAGEGG